jgi:predicted restriction endonuclease
VGAEVVLSFAPAIGLFLKCAGSPGILRAVRLTACQGIKDSLRRLYLDDPRNGLALSKNAHWQFDRGLWSITYDYRVIAAANRFDEAGDAAFLLKRMEGRHIQLPGSRDYWPDKMHLAWHRDNRFGGNTT